MEKKYSFLNEERSFSIQKRKFLKETFEVKKDIRNRNGL